MRIVIALGGNALLADIPGIVAGTAGTNVIAQPS